MKTTKLWALGILSLLTAYGCSTSSANDPAAGQANSADEELIFGTGSVDHAGVVEVTTMMLGPDTLSFPLLDPYNQADPFKINAGTFRKTFAKNLAAFDAYDGKVDWKPEQAASWVTRIASGNYLIVDTSKPCLPEGIDIKKAFAQPHTYLEIERAQMMGQPHATCGGRMPNEDSFDVTLNFLVRGPTASANDEGKLTDDVNEATHPSVHTFPYLADLNGF